MMVGKLKMVGIKKQTKTKRCVEGGGDIVERVAEMSNERKALF